MTGLSHIDAAGNAVAAPTSASLGDLRIALGLLGARLLLAGLQRLIAGSQFGCLLLERGRGLLPSRVALGRLRLARCQRLAHTG